MARRGDFSNDVAAVKATTDSEVASLLKLVGQETANAKSPAHAIDSKDSSATGNNGSRQLDSGDDPSDPRPAARETHGLLSTKPTTQDTSDDNVVLHNVTTRLSKTTNELLTEAALRQKLAKRKPDTRQDIIEVAVRRWINENRYE